MLEDRKYQLRAIYLMTDMVFGRALVVVVVLKVVCTYRDIYTHIAI